MNLSNDARKKCNNSAYHLHRKREIDAFKSLFKMIADISDYLMGYNIPLFKEMQKMGFFNLTGIHTTITQIDKSFHTNPD
jgi:hypothetical protein